MKAAKQLKNRRWMMVVVLDAPGITGAGGVQRSLARMQAHAEAGGAVSHPMRKRVL